MTTDQLREAGIALWGRRMWHVKLASKIPQMKPHHVAAMMDGEMPIPTSVRDVVFDGLRKRAATCLSILHDAGASL